MITLRELIEKLKREEETSLMEILDIHSDELVERFIDKVEEKFEKLSLEYDDSEYDEDEKELTGELNWGGSDEE